MSYARWITAQRLPGAFRVAQRWSHRVAAAGAAALISFASHAAMIEFDEPLEGSTRACVQGSCSTSNTATISGSTAGLASSAGIVALVPQRFQALINLVDLGWFMQGRGRRRDVGLTKRRA